MKTHTIALAFAVMGLLAGCEDAQKPGPAELQALTEADDLIGLLPTSTLAAVELLDLEARWDELRAIRPMANLQDHMLDALDLNADDVPAIAGDRMVVALVAGDNWRGLVPVAVLDPPSTDEARRRLADSDEVFAVEARGALWVGPATQARWVERLAAGDGTSLHQVVDRGALAERLPPGGLVRVVLNSRALGQWLRGWAEYQSNLPARALARLIAADLLAIEAAGLRRDIVDGRLVTDLWVGIDDEVVPDAIVQALAADRGPAVLPPELPANWVVAKSFRTEPEAGLAWLRALAARDPDGPLRQLDFWIDEFESRTGHDVESDIIASLGARGLALVLEGGDGGVELVAVIEARDPDRLEAALVELRDWLGEQIRGRTLGLARWQMRDGDGARGTAHALDVRSPFGRFSGPVFQVVNDHLVLATDQRSLSFGLELAGSAASWVTPVWAAAGGAPDEIAVIRMNALAGILAEAPLVSAGQSDRLEILNEFLAGVSEGRLRVDYEPDGFRMTGWLELAPSE
ncbi:MAG: hypothetical protein PVJ43_09345 [Gemmatimonadales bacterium]